MEFIVGDILLQFVPIQLHPNEYKMTDAFADKNNKNLAQTLQHQKYSFLKDDVQSNYSSSLNQPLGTF